jgi:RHS repeat-associated protein
MFKPAPSLSARSLTLVAAVLTAGVAAPASGQQILEIENSSLTAYLGSETGVQNILPPSRNRGVNIDGSVREPSLQGWACAGNPFGDGVGWNGHNRLRDIRLDAGTYNPTEVDLALPSIGVQWVIGRTFNGRQGHTSQGYQGRNWMQTSQPEIVLYEGASDPDDVLYIVYGADRFLEFKRVDSTDVFKGKNGTAGVVKRTAGVDNTSPTPDTPEKYEYIDQNGTVTTFFGLTYAAQAAGQIWRIEDTAGNRCYVGHATDMATAISSYNDSGDYPYGAIETAYDSAGRRYTYAYIDYAETHDGISRLSQVKAEIDDGGWVTVGQVDYDYYNSTIADVGRDGQLHHVIVTTPMTSGGSQVKTTYYRYYTRSWADSDGRRGHADQIKLVMEAEGWRRYENENGSFDTDHLTETETNLKPYSAAHFEYESAGTTRISKLIANGECGCSGGATGEYLFTYADSAYSFGTGYDQAWKSRTVVRQPDFQSGPTYTYFTQYFDETGQPLARVISGGDPASSSTLWVTDVRRDALGCISELRTPANNTSYTHSSTTGVLGDLLGSSGSVGLIHAFTRESSGDLKGFVTDRKWYVGTGADADHKFFEASSTHTTRTYTGTTPNIVRPLIDLRKEYTQAIASGSSGVNTTDLDYTFHNGTSTNLDYLAIESVTTKYPIVADTSNGPGGSTNTTMVQWFNAYGARTFAKAPDGIISYREYSTTTGQMLKSIEDADTDTPDADIGVAVPSGAESNGGGSDEIHNKTTYTYDHQGRVSTVTTPSGRLATTQYVALNDRRIVTLNAPAKSGSDYYGPASYSIINHMGKSEAQGTIGFGSGGGTTTTAPSGWVNAANNEYSCITTGTVTRLSTSLYSNAGHQVTDSRLYTNFATLTVGGANPWPGNQGGYSNFESTTFVYDELGRKIKVIDPTGTIDRTVFDALGRATAQWTGTSDTSFDPVSGGGNMVKISATVYDGGNDGGNSHVTSRTAFVQDSSTGERVTTLTNDDRGRAILITNPQSPHVLNKYDNVGRLIATAQYNAVTGLSVSSDPVNVETADSGNTDRLALSRTYFDQKGQVYRTERYKIDQTNGNDDDYLTTDFWYDAVGRRIKVSGEQLSKTLYDRLGRSTNRFTLALARESDGDPEVLYADADDVEYDVVLEEHQTVYQDTNNNVIFSVEILRHATESASTYGALDLNEDGVLTTLTAADVRGRVQITAHWYDPVRERLETTVAYGTNGIVGDDSTTTGTFTRSGSAPNRPNTTSIQTDYTYNSAGLVEDVKDALDKVTRTVYDDAGRRITTIANYVNGTPSSATGADDVHTRYVYTSGQQTKMWVDIDGDGTEDADDQVTSYTYGVTKGASVPDSKIASNRLIKKVTYPPNESGQAAADREVEYAYNAQQQQIYVEDQSGNIIQHDYDTAGRLTQRRVTNVASGFDGVVKRIATAYLARGMVDTVTQYDDPDVGEGSVKDQVQYTYDGWNPPHITKFEQDVDSAIAASGRAAFNIQYAYTPTTVNGREVMVRSSMTMPNGASLTYDYNDAFHVDLLTLNSVEIASYTYTGAGMVTETYLNESDLFMRQHYGFLGVYPDLDQFNRVTSSRWTKDLGTDRDIYDVDVTYDLAGNVTSTIDNLRKNAAGNRVFDVAYTMDGLHRLTKADEGTVSGGVVTGNRRVIEEWGLTQTGNFATNQCSLNGDTDYVDGGDLNDTRTHDADNSIETWNPAGSSLEPVYDNVGNMTNDACDYKFKYDVFGRLVEVKNQSNAVTTEYRYNGLGYRIGWHYDVDDDGTVENNADDPWVHHGYDERWRVVATFIASQSTPKEQFYYHTAGLGGYGGSSYIDSVILRDRDMTGGGGSPVSFTGAGDGTLEQRLYHLQNWRADVSVVIDYTSGVTKQAEAVKYFSYGTPVGLPAGDLDSDGDVELTSDGFTAMNWATNSIYDVRADMDLDGDVQNDDVNAILGLIGAAGGRGILSRTDVGNRKGYAGYESDGILGTTLIADSCSQFWHVRHRVLDSTLGRWTRRDPLQYSDGVSLFGYDPRPVTRLDPSGCASVRIVGQPRDGQPWTINPPPGKQGPGVFIPMPVPGWRYREVWPLPNICDGAADRQQCCENHATGMSQSCNELFPAGGQDLTECLSNVTNWLFWCQGVGAHNSQLSAGGVGVNSKVWSDGLSSVLGATMTESPVVIDPAVATPVAICDANTEPKSQCDAAGSSRCSCRATEGQWNWTCKPCPAGKSCVPIRTGGLSCR